MAFLRNTSMDWLISPISSLRPCSATVTVVSPAASLCMAPEMAANASTMRLPTRYEMPSTTTMTTPIRMPWLVTAFQKAASTSSM